MNVGWLQIRRWRLGLEIAIWRHGLVWSIVLALWLAVLVLWFGVLPGNERQLAAVQSQWRELQAGRGLRPTLRPGADADQQDAMLVSELDRVSLAERDVSPVLRRLARIAQSKGLSLTETDFQASGEGMGGLRRLQLTFPLRASYPQVRQFVEAVLLEFPGVSVDQMLIKRDSVRQGRGEISLLLSLWINPAKSVREGS